MSALEKPATVLSEGWPKLWQDARAWLRARHQLRAATHLGRRVRLWGRAFVANEGELRIGDRVQLYGTITPLELAVGPGAKLLIGERTFINYGCALAAQAAITIGPRCNLGTYVQLMDSDFHRIEPERRLERPEAAPIVLEENVWLATRVIVLRGVTIGAGSVVGAGSLVTEDIPPRSLAVGMPAKVIKAL